MLKLEDHTPKTMEEAIDLIADHLSDPEIDYILREGAETTHHGAGTAIRNAWLHDENHLLHQHFRTRFGLGHPDDMSSLILYGLTAKLRRKDFDSEVLAERFRVHWKKYNVDPLTQKDLQSGA